MAGWISSKLKVAENLLQQIDQQAAESLGKGERKASDELNFNSSPKPSGSVSLKDQLKKKTPDSIGKNEFIGKLSSDSSSNHGGRNDKSSSNDNESGKIRDKEVPKPDLKPDRPTLTDSDWTELLSTPKQSTPSKSIRANGVSGIRSGKKVRGKAGNVGLNLKGNGRVAGTILKGDGLGGRTNGVVGDGRKSDVEEESRGSNASLRVSGSGSDDNVIEGWELGQDLVGGEDNVGGKREEEGDKKEILGVPGNDNDLQPDKRIVKVASSSIDENPQVDSGSNVGVVSWQSSQENEADDGDRRIKKTSWRAGEPSTAVSNYASGGSKSGSDSGSEKESDSDSDSTSTSDSEAEREREERRKRRQQVLAAKAAAKADEAIKERENLVARLEGEKQSLEKILEERAKQAAQEASELQSTMMEIMEAAEVEKQKHNHTRMEALARLAKLETANADLARSLANAQWNLEVEVNRVAELRQQMKSKEVAQEELRRRIASTHQTGTSLMNLAASKGLELEREMLQAEYSFIVDKIDRQREKAEKLEANIESTRKDMEKPTEVEVELKRRLAQLTDHLIQKQAQVEALSSDKATLLFRIEAVSRLLEENESVTSTGDVAASLQEDLESGKWNFSTSKLGPMLEGKIRSGKHQFRSLVRQLDSVFSAGAVFLARNQRAKMWALVYLVCLHLWVMYIMFFHSRSTEEASSSFVVSLQNINNTIGK